MRPVFALAAAFALVGALVLSACGGSSSSSTTAAVASPAAASTTAATTSSLASPAAVSTSAASPASSPTALATASPSSSVSSSASPSAQAVSGPVNLATAYSNLESQGSYQMVAQIQNLPGVLSVVPGVSPSDTVTAQVSNGNRHVAIQNNSSTKIAELWKIGDQVWIAAAGAAPIQASANTPVVGALIPLALADQQLINGLADQGATYTVSGSDTINGVDTQVETATYQINPSNNLFLGSGPYTVNSKIWVAKSGGYLVQGQMQLLQGAGTPTASSPSIMINVTQVGQSITITAPSS